MIDRLVEYARNQDLTIESGFAAKSARWLINLAADGRYLGLVEIGDIESKRNRGRVFPSAPQLTQPEMVAGGVKKSQFLIEAAQVVALHDADPDDDKTRAKHDYFVELLQQAAGTDPRFAAAAAALADETTLETIQRDMTAHKVRAVDSVTLQVAGQILVESDVWHDWWREFRAGLKAPRSAEQQMRCFGDGALAEPARTHPKIKGLADVGGAAAGCALVSFDKEAFGSYGLQQSANAAMSETTAVGYTGALDNLLRRSSRRLGPARVAYWYDRDIPPENDPVAFLEDPGGQEDSAAEALQRAGAFFDALHTGRLTDLSGSRYCALTLSGASARVMVRDWMEGEFLQLAENIHQWFQDLTIVHRHGRRLAPWPKFLAVLAATARALDDVPGPRAARLWRVAIAGEPIPFEMLALALARVCVDIIQDQPLNHARMGLLKAYHLRKQRQKGSVFMTEPLTPHLNQDHPESAYHCGRLLALYANIQRAALGDVGAGVIQRYYAAASTTPALVLGRLARTSQFHLDKIESGGLAFYLQQQLAAVWSRLGDQVPRTLDLEQQSLFALGYYQQLASRPPKSDPSADSESQPADPQGASPDPDNAPAGESHDQ